MNPHTAIVLDLHTGQRPWRRWEAECLRALEPAFVLAVHGPEEAEAAAREAALEGAGKLVAVGGTGAAHGVLNALMALAAPHRAQLKFGLLNLGRPEEWSRTLGLPREPLRQLEVLRAGHTLPFDAGRVECLDFAGRPVTRYFLNGACFGIPGEVRAAWRGFRRERGEPPEAPESSPALRALARALRMLVGREGSRVRIDQDDPEGERGIDRGPWVAGLVMVGRYYPGFGEVAPQADPSDGMLDLVGVSGVAGLRTLGWLSGWLRSGLPRPGWTMEKGEGFTATDGAGPVALELDGIPLGTLPARFTIVPRQVPTIVPAVPARLMKPQFKPIPAAVGKRSLVAGRSRTELPLGA